MVVHCDDTAASTLTKLEEVENFKDLGAYISSSEKDMRDRKGQAGMHKIKRIWKSDVKCSLFIVTIECLLLYKTEAWTFTSEEGKTRRDVHHNAWDDPRLLVVGPQGIRGPAWRTADGL